MDPQKLYYWIPPLWHNLETDSEIHLPHHSEFGHLECTPILECSGRRGTRGTKSSNKMESVQANLMLQ